MSILLSSLADPTLIFLFLDQGLGAADLLDFVMDMFPPFKSPCMSRLSEFVDEEGDGERLEVFLLDSPTLGHPDVEGVLKLILHDL